MCIRDRGVPDDCLVPEQSLTAAIDHCRVVPWRGGKVFSSKAEQYEGPPGHFWGDPVGHWAVPRTAMARYMLSLYKNQLSEFLSIFL